MLHAAKKGMCTHDRSIVPDPLHAHCTICLCSKYHKSCNTKELAGIKIFTAQFKISKLFFTWKVVNRDLKHQKKKTKQTKKINKKKHQKNRHLAHSPAICNTTRYKDTLVIHLCYLIAFFLVFLKLSFIRCF